MTNAYKTVKTLNTCDRGTFIIAQKPKGKKFFKAFIANNGTFTKVSSTGYDTLQEAAW